MNQLQLKRLEQTLRDAEEFLIVTPFPSPTAQEIHSDLLALLAKVIAARLQTDQSQTLPLMSTTADGSWQDSGLRIARR